MALKKWGQMTPREINQLDKDKTIVILPLGMLGAADDTERVWAALRDLEASAKEMMDSLNRDDQSPLDALQATVLPALWFGSAPGPAHVGTVTLPEAAYKDVVKTICLSVRDQGFNSVLLVADNDDLARVARAVTVELLQGEPRAWVAVHRPGGTNHGGQAAGPVAAVCLVATALVSGVPNPACLLIPG